jgi:hypothetical protein
VQVNDKLIVALDFNSAEAATQMTDKLRGRVGMFKVGMEAFTAEGPMLARYLIDSGEKVFLDLKVRPEAGPDRWYWPLPSSRAWQLKIWMKWALPGRPKAPFSAWPAWRNQRG